jgi:hypothetical protein
MAAKPTRIVVYFDDGTQWEMSADEVGSIFLKESKAVKCGHKPPYKKPPKQKSGSETSTATFAAMSGTGSGETGGEASVQEEGEGCYIIGGVIVCP